MISDKCTKEVFRHMEDALAVLLRGLTDYMNGESDNNRSEMLDGIANCQIGARNAMMGLILWNIPMGLSHAIGHQLGSTCGVMHGVTSCIMLAPVLRYNASKSEKQRHLQQSVLEIWNKVLERDESSLADAVANFVKSLGLPSTLREVGIQEPADIEKVVDSTMTDVFGAMEGMGQKQDVLAILESAKGRETEDGCLDGDAPM
jgi:alcohol dehydrogenase class IV